MLTSTGRRCGAALLFNVALAGGCSKGDGGTGPGNSSAIAISVGPASVTVGQGGSTTVTATITRTGGFSGDVLLTVEGAPAGVTGSASDISTSGGVTTATITI